MNRALNIAIGMAVLIGELRSAEPVKWLSPAGNLSFELSFGKAGEPVLTALANSQANQVIESPLIASPVSREFGGITWFTDAKSKWVDGRYLVFEADDRLALLDAESKQMILNTAFEALSKAPSGDRWSAVRYRPIGRQQERLTADFRDTLFVIDLKHTIKESASANEGSKPFEHLKSSKLPGSALTKPVWTKGADGELLAIAVLVGGKPTAFALKPESLDVIGQKPLSIAVTDEVAQSPWINLEAEPEIRKAMLAALSEAPSTTQDSLTSKLSPSVQPTAPKNAPEAKLTVPTPSEEPTSSTPWSIIVVLIVAATGLLWLLVKNRR
jgi:hypothetical protein